MNSVIIVLFFPDESIIDKIKFYLRMTDFVVLIDNTPFEFASDFSWIDSKVVVYKSFGENLGVAYALNEGMNISIKLGCEYCFLFDQDSQPVEKNYTKIMISELDALCLQGLNVGILAPDVIDEANSSVKYRWLANNKDMKCFFQRKSLDDKGWDRSALIAITSGSLMPSLVFKQCGEFRDDYFIDYIDTEYCLRLVNKGYVIMVTEKASLLHNLGARVIHKIAKLSVNPTNHSSLRRYYIARNSVDMWKRFAMSNPDWAMFDFVASVYNAFRIVCFETNRFEKIKYCALGYYHGLIGRFGRLDR